MPRRENGGDDDPLIERQKQLGRLRATRHLQVRRLWTLDPVESDACVVQLMRLFALVVRRVGGQKAQLRPPLWPVAIRRPRLGILRAADRKELEWGD